MIILDSHCDTPLQLARGRNISIEEPFAGVDIPKLRRGGVSASFFAAYTNPSLSETEAFAWADKLIDLTQAQIKAHPEDLAAATSAGDIRKNWDNNLISILISLENGSPIGKDIRKLHHFHERGARIITLCHNGDNAICDSAAGNATHGGLSEFGREVVSEMNSLGIIVDMAHASDKTFYDCIEASRKPIVSTHSSCRALAGHRRNMTDDMIRVMAERGGVIQINFYPFFIDDSFNDVYEASGLEASEYLESEFAADPGNEEKRSRWMEVLGKMFALPSPSYTVVADHIMHAVNVGGIEAVGIGTDFDGINMAPAGLEDISKLGVLFDELSRRGLTDDQVAKIAGENFLRVMDDNGC